MKIAHKARYTSSGWMELLGHNCMTRKEMEEFVNLAPHTLQLVEDEFNFGCMIEPPDAEPEPMTPEFRAAVKRLVMSIKADMK